MSVEHLDAAAVAERLEQLLVACSGMSQWPSTSIGVPLPHVVETLQAAHRLLDAAADAVPLWRRGLQPLPRCRKCGGSVCETRWQSGQTGTERMFSLPERLSHTCSCGYSWYTAPHDAGAAS